MPTYRYWPIAAGLGASKLTASTALASLMASTGYAVRALHEQSGEYTTQEQVTPPSRVITAYLSQSEPVSCTETGRFYQILTPPDPTRAGSLVVIQRNGANETVASSSTTTAITAMNKQQVNPSMLILANALEYITPGVDYAFVELGEAGTGRTELVNDSKAGRQWHFTADMVADCVAEFGRLPDRIGEFWYANDQSAEPYWLRAFSPLYYGQLENGAAFALHNKNPDLAGDSKLKDVIFDHCLWDFEESNPAEVGRGLFSRTMPFDLAPHCPWGKDINFQLGIDKFAHDSRFQALGGVYGPPASQWYTQDMAHPGKDHWAGIGEAALMFFLPTMLRSAGVDVVPPKMGDLYVAPGGAYAEVALTEGNGGYLSTKAAIHGMTPDQDWLDNAPEFQEVMGFGILRAGDPGNLAYYICRPGVGTGIDEKYRGTVTLVGGKIRFTPTIPFQTGDIIFPQRSPPAAQTTVGYYRQDYTRYSFWDKSMIRMWYPIEHVPEWYDPEATWGLAGWEINLWQEGWKVGEIEPAAHFTLTGAGPVFRDTADVPASTTKVRHKIVIRVPYEAAFANSSRCLFGIVANGFDIDYHEPTDSMSILKIEDTTGSADLSPSPKPSLGRLHRNIWNTLEFYVDLAEVYSGATGVFACRFNGGLWQKFSLSSPGNGAFATGRRLHMYGVPNSTGRRMGAGVQIAEHTVWLTTGGVETERMRVAGSAATVNASVYKDPSSGNAV
ncbi:hypothetical protein [Haematobacter genomosp. 1]|uniref:Uncharacterized protein n=1 Tax=Haematobacter genomosp. 1 TaxID=366618 RepID=A0A212AC23_9RHOB|nr:hypothetical protein [Haematobacter genomosp. 1]OWJ78432.1 hypothetical protein CDV49_08325 [Haematobacter genomosp. 1]